MAPLSYLLLKPLSDSFGVPPGISLSFTLRPACLSSGTTSELSYRIHILLDQDARILASCIRHNLWSPADPLRVWCGQDDPLILPANGSLGDNEVRSQTQSRLVLISLLHGVSVLHSHP